MLINCIPSIKNYAELKRSKQSYIYEVVSGIYHQYIEVFYELKKGDKVVLNDGTWEVIGGGRIDRP